MKVDLNKKLRYSYGNGLYAEEVGRFNTPDDTAFMVVFRGDGYAVSNATTKKVFTISPNTCSRDVLGMLRNYPITVPWEFQDIKLDAWYRSIHNPQYIAKISSFHLLGSVYFLEKSVPVDGLVKNFEWTLDNPLDKKTVWHSCTKEVPQ